MRNRSVTLCLLLTAAMLMIGCSGTETQKVASYSKAVSQGLGEAYTIVCTVTDAFPVSKESQAEIDQIFTKANTIILQINAITRAIDASGAKTIGAPSQGPRFYWPPQEVLDEHRRNHSDSFFDQYPSARRGKFNSHSQT